MGAAVATPDNKMAETAIDARVRFLMNPPDLSECVPLRPTDASSYDKSSVPVMPFR